jgi:hypothetical protein
MSFEEQPSATYRDLAEAAIVAAILGRPFWNAFCTELGKRWGGSAADWASRIRARRKQRGVADIEIPLEDCITTVEINSDLPEEARLALFDLDLTAEGVRGHRMRWDPLAKAWVTSGQ